MSNVIPTETAQRKPSSAAYRVSFLNRLRAEGTTEGDLASYRKGLERLAEHLDPRAPEEVTPDDARTLIEHLRDRGVTENSLSAYRHVIDCWMEHVRGVVAGGQATVDG